MADIAATLAGWSSTTGSNAPSGGTTIGTGLDDNLREIQGVIVRGLSHKGADIASATTTDLGAVEGLAHDITGTTTITGFGTVRAGIWKVIKFEGALTLTHNATSLILPGAANITTADGDTAIVISEGSGNWRCVAYVKANGRAIVEPSGAITSSAYTMATARLLGRTTASTGAIEEISVGSGLSLSSGALSSDGTFQSIEIFTAGGTWTKPAGIKRVKVTVVGGGGGGGGAGATSASQLSTGAGGGAGGAAIKVIEAASLGATETVTVGSGGAGSAGAAGATGGTSSFGAHCSATGGSGANAITATSGTGEQPGAAGGAGSGGDINLTGGGGAVAQVAAGAPLFISGQGGNSIFGAGARGVVSNTAGANGNAYGGGGGGASNNISQSARAGGTGGGGVVIVEEFF